MPLYGDAVRLMPASHQLCLIKCHLQMLSLQMSAMSSLGARSLCPANNAGSSGCAANLSQAQRPCACAGRRLVGRIQKDISVAIRCIHAFKQVVSLIGFCSPVL